MQEDGGFVHLHVHSEFSLLDGANRIKDLPVRAKELGMKAIAITDHGAMFGVIDFYKECKKNGIKPIIGCEVYVAPRGRKDREPSIDNKYNHLILLAKNNEGYKNLSKLVSLSYLEGFYYKPRIDKEILEKYSEGLVCCSACLAGEVSQAILANDLEEAKKSAIWFKNLFKDDYYLEIQNNGIREQVLVNQKLVQISRELNIPLVATNDAHYLKKEDAYNHEVLLCIQTGKRMSDEDRMKFETDELYVKSPEEMMDYFRNIPDSIENTVKIAEKCNVEFEFGNTVLPNYEVPREYNTHYDFFKEKCDEGIRRRYGQNPSKEILERAEYELSVIKKMGYVDYFLIVSDFINYAHEQEIPVGPGRGSGAGSIIAYAIGITDIDPIKYNLIFERFLNPERISMPDFDIDFCTERRQKVIDYVGGKYGKDHVSQIITFGTMAAKMVIRDVARVLDVPYAEADKLSKMIPTEVHITIKRAMELNKELREAYDSNKETKKLLDIAMALEGMPRQASTHACGVVITKEPVDTYVPLYVRDGQISTQYIMTTLEELGLLKMDFLGLRNLTVIKDAIDIVKGEYGIEVEFDKEMNDPKVFKIWQDGNTTGIFQFESQGMTNFMKELKPDCLEDIIAGVSLYRPGPMDQIPRYIANKKDMENAVYTHPALKPILQVTYGCMIYQEQVMQIVRDLAGYSLGRADLVRRAMGKKKLDVMAKEREYFIYGKIDENGNIEIPGCIRNGIDEKSANKIFDEMAEFAKYAFNKSHAAAYSVVSYRTAYLKTYYPREFMAAMLNSFLGNLDKVSEQIDDCKRMNIKILRPNINKSCTKFVVDKEGIRFGLGSIKNVGTGVVDKIVTEREKNGEFTSFIDFCERMKENSNVNKKIVESLIKAGVFSSFNKNIHTLMDSFEGILSTMSNQNKKNIEGQMSLFDFGNQEENEEMKYVFNQQEEYSKRELLSMEKEMLGIYLSGHPLESIKDQIEKQTNITSRDLKKEDDVNEEDLMDQEQTVVESKVNTNLQDGQAVKYAGVVISVKKKFTKSNKIMAFVTIEDLHGQIEVMVFENVYLKCVEFLKEDSIVFVDGRLSIRDDNDVTLIARNISLFKEEKQEKVYIDITSLDEEKRGLLRGYIRMYAKQESNICPLYIINGEKTLESGNISVTAGNIETLKGVVGKENVKVD